MYFGVSRSTVYRYISDNKHWYDQKQKAERLAIIQAMLCQGHTTLEIANELREPLKRINKLVIDNNISAYKCKL